MAKRRPVGEALGELLSSLPGRLTGLMVLGALPVLLIVGISTVARYADAEAAALRELHRDRDLTLAAISGRLDGADAVIRSIALTVGPDLPACGDWMRSLSDIGLELRLLAPVLASCGAAPPMQSLAATFDDGVVQPIPGGAWQITRTVPGAGQRRLVATVAPVELPTDLLAWAMDGSGSAWPLSPSAAAIGPPRVAGDEASAADGTMLVASRARLTPILDLIVARQEAPVRRAAWAAGAQRLGETLALLMLSLAAVVIGTRHAVTNPLLRLRHAVTAWRSGDGPLQLPDMRHDPSELRDLADSFRAGADALAARERQLQAAIERAELLSAEVHHRVKNNLQVVSSLLALQANRVTDAQARSEFEAARDRVGALATLHRHMYSHHDLEAIDLAAFVEELCQQLFAAVGDRPGQRIALTVQAPSLRISSDQAVPLALIITEAVSGALHQGFPPGHTGRIAIVVEADDRRATLAIEDDGVATRQDDTLRTQLLRGLARQLGGELQRGAATLTLSFPLRPPSPLPAAIRPSVPAAAPKPPAPSAPA